MQLVAESELVGLAQARRVNPILDRENMTARTAVGLVASALGKTSSSGAGAPPGRAPADGHPSGRTCWRGLPCSRAEGLDLVAVEAVAEQSGLP